MSETNSYNLLNNKIINDIKEEMMGKEKEEMSNDGVEYIANNGEKMPKQEIIESHHGLDCTCAKCLFLQDMHNLYRKHGMEMKRITYIRSRYISSSMKNVQDNDIIEYANITVTGGPLELFKKEEITKNENPKKNDFLFFLFFVLVFVGIKTVYLN
jgi:hypothetical protein